MLPTLADLEVGLNGARRALLLEPPSSLERRLEREYRNGWLLLVALGAGCLGLSVLALLHPTPILWVVVSFAALVILRWLVWVYQARRGEHRLEDAPSELLGKYSREEIAELVRRASEGFPPGERPAVFVREGRLLGNASANNSWLFDFSPRHNAIGVDSYLLYALDAEELRAVVLHELAHFHHHIEPARRNFSFVLLSSIPFWAGLFSAIGSPLWPLHVLLCAIVYFARSRLLKRRAAVSQVLELACDAKAAASGGALPIINALLKTAERNDLAASILRETEDAVLRRPLEEVLAAQTKFRASLPHEPLTADDALALFRRLLSENQADPSPKPNQAAGVEEVLAPIRQELARLRVARILPWRDFDVRLADQKLDQLELDGYVKRLLSSTASASHEDQTIEARSFHPPTKERILYLYIHFVRPASFVGLLP